MRKVVALGFVGGMSMLLLACGGGPQPIPPLGRSSVFFYRALLAAPETEWLFPDLPIPRRFQLDPSRSFLQEQGPAREGRLVYTGSGDIEQIVSFYKAMLPDYHWRVTEVLFSQTATISAEKGDLSLVIVVSQEEGKTLLAFTFGGEEEPRG